VTANPPAVAILALEGCSRVVDGQPCEVCLFRAAKDVAAVERGGLLVVVSAEDLHTYVVDEEPLFSDYVSAQARLRAALSERTSS
jgi:hypothetical protein